MSYGVKLDIQPACMSRGLSAFFSPLFYKGDKSLQAVEQRARQSSQDFNRLGSKEHNLSYGYGVGELEKVLFAKHAALKTNYPPPFPFGGHRLKAWGSAV